MIFECEEPLCKGPNNIPYHGFVKCSTSLIDHNTLSNVSSTNHLPPDANLEYFDIKLKVDIEELGRRKQQMRLEHSAPAEKIFSHTARLGFGAYKYGKD
jgi:hypothetical protein